jgi:YesN/AraC family two-component response regulator
MKKILVVDDNIMMRKLIINLLKQHHVTFDEAGDGNEGLEKMTEIQYDLVITDILMPRMEGIEMIREVKRRHPGISIIAVSGGEPFYLYMAKKLGIQGIFTKPIDQLGFSAAVTRILQLPNTLLQAI